MVTTGLLDSDIVAYKFASSNEKKFDWDGDGDVVRSVEDIDEIMRQTLDYVEELIVKLKLDELIVCLSCPTPENFRLDVLPSYKSNRDPDAKPLMLSLVKERMASAYQTYARPRLEADDIMGILSTSPKILKGKKIIISEDKDMQTIPGWLYNPRKDRKPRLISKDSADYFHLYQTIIGDSTDFYKGCPGAGPTLAEGMLNDCVKYVPVHREITRGKNKGEIRTSYEVEPSDSPWETVVSIFNKFGFTEEDALVQARVARILRASDYNFTTKEVILWTP